MPRVTQGRWDIAERWVQFAAGATPVRPEFYLVAVNDLYGDKGDDFIEGLLTQGHRILLDSGIFNLTNDHMRATGCTMDVALSLPPNEIEGFDRLFTRYVELTKRWGDDLWGYIELDQGGAVNKRITRARLHDLGLDPIPVYHPLNDGWDYFDELAQGYSRMCYGNIVQAPPATRLRLLHAMWERHRAYPDLWIHVLGMTPNETCLTFSPDSCDSSTWLSGLRWPTISLGSTTMTRLGSNTHKGFVYELGTGCEGRSLRGGDRTGIASPTGSRHHRTATTDGYAACGMYSDEVEFMTHLWRRITDDRAAELGENPRAPYDKREAALCPASK